MLNSTQLEKMVSDDNSFIQQKTTQSNSLKLYFASIGMNRFSWSFNEKIIASARLIESELFLKGYVGCVKVGEIFYIVPITSIKYNYCYEITEFMIERANNGSTPLPVELFGGMFTVDNINNFVLYNSYDWYLTYDYINRQIDRLASLQIIYYSLLEKMQQPYIIYTTDKKILDSKIHFMQTKLEDIIYTERDNVINVMDLNINTQYVDKLENEIENLFTEIHGILGVTYNRFPKKERLIQSEMIATNEIKELFSTSLLQSRIDFIEKINKYGDYIDVIATLDNLNSDTKLDFIDKNFNKGDIKNNE